MGNPIAILIRPSLALLLCFALVVGYGALAVGSIDRDGDACGDDVSRVELLR